ncbi:reverse transcriptase domain, Reverse transcriptase zinc-binding domain protein [Artemisia annua]|uniref:Reverse transcriptase domain, Reverse transcriptase zinc-binding domain protein n=1 Tax=Artemisia annua TaxID=35608 RepID=A0A2U1MZN7_ARTAN|nr:reverse transcriptase domain, Reverse transcriptase zinc-binding domain protein [Artemisia annua]
MDTLFTFKICNNGKWSLDNTETVEGADLAILMATVQEVNNRFSNTLVGYFIGKRLAFPIAENCVKNTWAKYGIMRVMMNSNGFFFNFFEDGLSMIATKLWKPIMLDAYTSTMYLESWGRTSYARALIEITLDQDLKENLVVAIPRLNGMGYTMENIRVEYERQPPRCDACKVFGHYNDQCPMNINVGRSNEVKEDGFTTVTRKGGRALWNIRGMNQSPKQNEVRQTSYVLGFFGIGIGLRMVVVDEWCSDVVGYSMFRRVKKLKFLKKPLRKLLKDKGNIHEQVKSLQVVDDEWCSDVVGCNMFRRVKKLKFLKKTLRKLLKDKGNLHERVKSLRVELDEVQKTLDIDPSNDVLRKEEALYLHAFHDALIDEERFLKQRAKIEWLRAGDSNLAYFHKVVKSRVSRSRIDAIVDSSGISIDGENVNSAFISHYVHFFGSNRCQCSIWVMINPWSRGAWDIVGRDVVNAVREFFTSGKLLKEVNYTIIALIPKVSSPIRINDYQPISCCNVIFQCVTEIISNRMKDSLTELLVKPWKRLPNSREHLVLFLVFLVAYFCNVFNHTKLAIPSLLPFEEAKVSWDSICLPKNEGGLGIRRLEDFNVALITSLIWSILTLKESFWVKWIHTHKFRCRSFWDVPPSGNMSWGWRKLLQVRPKVRSYFWYHIGDGKSVLIWFDRWCVHSPLLDHITVRDISRACFSMSDKVVDVLDNGTWKWPMEWALRYPLFSILLFLILI